MPTTASPTDPGDGIEAIGLPNGWSGPAEHRA
jgi:hypothetical protein